MFTVITKKTSSDSVNNVVKSLPIEAHVGACQISANIQYMDPMVLPWPSLSILFCQRLWFSAIVFIPIAWASCEMG